MALDAILDDIHNPILGDIVTRVHESLATAVEVE
jgi:hypothetical protein